jgi:hypothetical protein
MKSYTCDKCKKGIDAYHDMIEGNFSKIVNYHPGYFHISTIEIRFIKDHSKTTPAPDLCEKCVIESIIDAIKRKAS